MEEQLKLFVFNESDAEQVKQSDNNAHSHDFEELIIGQHGGIKHFIDFSEEQLKAPFISFVTKGKVHKIVPELIEGKYKIWVIRFKSDFLAENIFNLYFTYHQNANIKWTDHACFERVLTLTKMIFDEYSRPNKDLIIIKNLLVSLFSIIESELRNNSQLDDLKNNHNITFSNFLKILEENFRRPLGIDFYAEKLFMSTRNLNLICKQIMNQSISEIIENRKLTEAKNLLISSNKSISEIGYELGYSENAYFSHVFKKKTGLTPSEFKAQINALIS